MTVTTVYILSHVSIVLSLLLANVNEQQRTYPDGVHILASDFNYTWLKSVLLNFVQPVNCASGGSNTLLYTSICLLQHKACL